MGSSNQQGNGSEQKREAKKRRRSAEEKREIAEASLQPGASAREVAQAYGVHPSQIGSWRRWYRSGLVGDTSASMIGCMDDEGIFPLNRAPVVDVSSCFRSSSVGRVAGDRSANLGRHSRQINSSPSVWKPHILWSDHTREARCRHKRMVRFQKRTDEGKGLISSPGFDRKAGGFSSHKAFEMILLRNL
jgi:hypothetical protein